MTRDELLKLAESGNINAMIAVAEQYEKEGTGECCYNALEWFEKAANSGNKYASLKAAANCITLARLFEDIDCDDDAMNMWRRGVYNASNGIPDVNDDMSNFDIALQMVEECVYGVAVWNYLNQDFTSAMKNLNSIGVNKGCIRANLLYAECLKSSINRLFTDSEKDAMKTLIVTAFANESDYATRQVVGNARHMEQLIFARATQLLSLLLDKKTVPYILAKAHQALTDESAIRVIDGIGG